MDTFPKFRFVGDPRRSDATANNPPTITAHGITFELNGPTVEVKDPKIAASLRMNRHFAEGDAPKVKAEPPPPPPAAPEPRPSPRMVPKAPHG